MKALLIATSLMFGSAAMAQGMGGAGQPAPAAAATGRCRPRAAACPARRMARAPAATTQCAPMAGTTGGGRHRWAATTVAAGIRREHRRRHGGQRRRSGGGGGRHGQRRHVRRQRRDDAAAHVRRQRGMSTAAQGMSGGSAMASDPSSYPRLLAHACKRSLPQPRRQIRPIRRIVRAPEPDHRLIERRQEARAVRLREWRRTAADLVHRAQIGHQRAGGDGVADRGGVERPAGRPEHRRAGLDAAIGEQDVGGDDDAARVRRLGDPVIGRVEAAADDDSRDQRLGRHADNASSSPPAPARHSAARPGRSPPSPGRHRHRRGCGRPGADALLPSARAAVGPRRILLARAAGMRAAAIVAGGGGRPAPAGGASPAGSISTSSSAPAVRRSDSAKRSATLRGIWNSVSRSPMRIAPTSLLVMWPRRQSKGSSQRGSALALRPMFMRNQTVSSKPARGPSGRAGRSSGPPANISSGSGRFWRWVRTKAAAISSALWRSSSWRATARSSSAASPGCDRLEQPRLILLRGYRRSSARAPSSP